MSTFKLKPDKKRHHNEFHTLDETHRKKMAVFQKKKDQLPKKRTKLKNLENKLKCIEDKDAGLYNNSDITLRSKFKNDIKEISAEIYDITHDISETEYLSSVDDILMDYFDILEQEDDTLYKNNPELCNEKYTEETTELDEPNLSDHNISALDRLNMIKKKKRKVKSNIRKKKYKSVNSSQNSIFNYLDIESKDEEKCTSNNNTNRAELHEQYIMLTDSKSHNNEKRSLNSNFCSECNIEKVLLQSEGIYVCRSCNQFDMVITELENPMGGDNSNMGMDNKGYPYKRKNHFSEWLSQIQAKESTVIPEEVYSEIKQELDKQRFYDLRKLDLYIIKRVLKKLNLSPYYEHSSYIISKLTGLPPPTLSRENEDILRKMFDKIQIPFERNCPSDRINFLSYSYVLHKFCELLELDDFIKYFPLLKSGPKLRIQDKIWKDICKDLRWQFIPSKPR